MSNNDNTDGGVAFTGTGRDQFSGGRLQSMTASLDHGGKRPAIYSTNSPDSAPVQRCKEDDSELGEWWVAGTVRYSDTIRSQ